MALITATNGTTYHLFGLPDLSAPEPEDIHEITVLENELSDGYRSRELFGQPAGVMSWRLEFPTLAATDVPVPLLTSFSESGEVSREKYLRTLVANNKVTGLPFGFQYPRTNGQYYLVDAVDDALTYTRRKGANIYSTSVTFRQRRINNVSVFDVTKITEKGGTGIIVEYLKPTNFSGATWTATTGANGAATGDVAKVSAAQNGQDIVRFNNSANTGYVTATCPEFYEAFIPMKMREATFSNAAGLLTGTAGVPILVGSSGTTKFASQSFTAANFEYRLNGDVYAQSDQQAPMNTWGIVHVRLTTGFTPTTIQWGRNQATAGTYAEVDMGEPVLTGLLSKQVARELTEHLKIKYGIS